MRMFRPPLRLLRYGTHSSMQYSVFLCPAYALRRFPGRSYNPNYPFMFAIMIYLELGVSLIAETADVLPDSATMVLIQVARYISHSLTYPSYAAVTTIVLSNETSRPVIGSGWASNFYMTLFCLISHIIRKLSAPVENNIFSCLLKRHFVTKLVWPPKKLRHNWPFSMSNKFTIVSFAHVASHGERSANAKSLTGKKWSLNSNWTSNSILSLFWACWSFTEPSICPVARIDYWQLSTVGLNFTQFIVSSDSMCAT